MSPPPSFTSACPLFSSTPSKLWFPLPSTSTHFRRTHPFPQPLITHFITFWLTLPLPSHCVIIPTFLSVSELHMPLAHSTWNDSWWVSSHPVPVFVIQQTTSHHSFPPLFPFSYFTHTARCLSSLFLPHFRSLLPLPFTLISFPASLSPGEGCDSQVTQNQWFHH